MTDSRKKKTRPPVFGELRPSQIITSFGPGSVVDLRNISVVMSGIEFWTTRERQEIDEPRLRSMMRVSRFFRPPVRSDGGGAGVPAFLFPGYLRCPRCSRLGAASRKDLFLLGKRPMRFRCNGDHRGYSSRKAPLVFPARFVVSCEEGHLDDFPWSAYVHRGEVECEPEMLTFSESSKSAAISELVVRCDTCDSWRTMEDAFGPRAEKALGPCSCRRPWLRDEDPNGCDTQPRTTLRGASNLFFAISHSALSIPEWDDPVHVAIAHHEEALAQVETLVQLQMGLDGGFLPRLSRFEPEIILDALQKRRDQAKKKPTSLDLKYEEIAALRAIPDPQRAAEREFQTEPVEVPDRYRDFIGRVVVVRRLREVRALGGFTRIDNALASYLSPEQAAERYRIQSLSATDPGWRPAVELRGEGIFIELSEKFVSEWEERAEVRERTSALEHAHQTWLRERDLPEAPYPGARFVLLHSLAHMLIQGLALDCGYSSSSIRERIYSSSKAGARMAGILLYTATPDSDGSLGGLAEKGIPHRLGPLLTDALVRAGYCSSDPLCGHHAPGDTGTLNGAACHACLLVSETSCERSNRYLDRAHVVPTVSLLGTNYFEL